MSLETYALSTSRTQARYHKKPVYDCYGLKIAEHKWRVARCNSSCSVIRDRLVTSLTSGAVCVIYAVNKLYVRVVFVVS